MDKGIEKDGLMYGKFFNNLIYQILLRVDEAAAEKYRRGDLRVFISGPGFINDESWKMLYANVKAGNVNGARKLAFKAQLQGWTSAEADQYFFSGN